jgi:polysaccharide pyruvyl transferase WcaK-like protein
VVSAAFLANFRSVNLGNDALTAEVGRHLRDAYGAAKVTGFHRLAESLNTRLRAQRADAFAPEADDWARQVVAAPTRAAEAGGLEAMEFGVHHQAMLGGPGSARRVAAAAITRLPLVRSVRAGRQSAAVLDQLAREAAHDHVIYMPAGEINPAGEPVTRLLEVAVAQRAGNPTALVNFSFEPTPLVARLAQEVLPRCNAVYVRDERSIPRLIESGAKRDSIRVVPDAVIGALLKRRDPVRAIERVGVAFNATLDSANLRVWTAAVTALQEVGIEVTLLSNEHGRDERSLARVARDTRAPLLPPPTSFADYARELADLDLVVSTRFHTLVLALVAGVRAVGVEGTSDRIRGALDVFGLHDVVVDARPAAGDFDNAIVRAVLDGGCALDAAQVGALADDVRAGYAQLPGLLA